MKKADTNVSLSGHESIEFNIDFRFVIRSCIVNNSIFNSALLEIIIIHA